MSSQISASTKKSRIPKQQWKTEEDLLIYVLFLKYGENNWGTIAEQLNKRIHGSNRNFKQCKDRWTD